MLAATSSDNRESLSARGVVDGSADGLNTAFLAWAQRRMIASSHAPTYRLLIAPERSNYALPLWSMYQLSPARQVTTGHAGWLVIYGTPAPVGAYDADASRRVFVFRPGFELVEEHRR